MVMEPGFWDGRRVLVTGHSGFKGTWLTLWLGALGARVTGMARRPAADGSLFHRLRGGDGVAEVRADLCDPAAVAAAFAAAEPEVVLHLGGQPLVREAVRAPRDTFATNVLGTAHVLDAAAASPSVRSIVVVGSIRAYADRAPGRTLHEDDALGPPEPYGASKAAQEQLVAAYREAVLGPRGIGVATVRTSNVIGGGDTATGRLIPDLVRAGLSGQAVEIREPDAVLPWQHVLNPLAGYLLLAQALADDPSLATAFNFGPGLADAWPVRRVVERLEALWERPLAALPEAERAPARPARMATSRARERLGWRPVWSLEQGLEALVNWVRAQEAGDDLRAATLAQIALFTADARAAQPLAASYSPPA